MAQPSLAKLDKVLREQGLGSMKEQPEKIEDNRLPIFKIMELLNDLPSADLLILLKATAEKLKAVSIKEAYKMFINLSESKEILDKITKETIKRVKKGA